MNRKKARPIISFDYPIGDICDLTGLAEKEVGKMRKSSSGICEM